MNRSGAIKYDLQERIFQNNGTYASYPFVISGGSKEERDALNKVILGDINKILSLYSADAFLPPAKDTDLFLRDTLHIGYVIMRNDETYLSIFYTADFFSPYGAYPTQMIYTTNIDLKNIKRLKLQDLITVDVNFIDKVLSGNPVNVNPDYIRGIKDYFQGLGMDVINRGFAFADIIGPGNFLGIFSYIKPDVIGISISVPNYLGNHVEYEIE
ncbi:hypothetical protein DFR55_101393 [Herbinix hemicellulosilytica]|uniref:DUF3298 domain-containing protein n=1 Tax=Herbinix hemicellulosilytica TaxID=1564487 RepID=A0A0H5SGK1_HERHM|nr:hypothetical protein [Herbinix hemicellulosilytica]RBP60932.1 hypothetical protein DFR55_101393 [Herbinix hemicellulosilytica]CRZ34627.1 hypothetical protein HHT355_1426 [Herbinix hemicellulosilytica]